MKTADVRVVNSTDAVFMKLKARSSDFFNDALILVEKSGFSLDMNFLSKIVFGPEFKKLSSRKHITEFPFIMKKNETHRKTRNVLCSFVKNDTVIGKMTFEFREIERSLTHFAELFLFGQYRILDSALSYRFCATSDEGMHFDTFKAGLSGKFRPSRRTLKIFLNVDSEPRIWRVGPTLHEFCRVNRDRLPDEVPADVNTFCYVIDKLGFLDDASYQQVEIPPGGMMIGNGTMVAHQVVYGNRMVCLEAIAQSIDPEHPSLSEQESFSAILDQEGISSTEHYPDLDSLSEQDGSMQRASKRTQAAEASQG